jgi:hypothetical protein
MDYKKIKSYETACKALGIEPLSDEVFNAFPKEERKNVKAYHQLTVITRAINEGWEPDFSNREQRKYEPYMYVNNAGLAYAYTAYTPSDAYAAIGSRLCFSDYERATFAVNTFKELYTAYFLPGKWEDEAQEPAGAAEKEQEQPAADGGDETIREEDDMTDAPDFLKQVAEITKSQIQPLQDADTDNRGIILIAVQDNAEDGNGEKGFGVTFAVAGTGDNLSKGLARFLKHKASQEIIKKAYLRIKFEEICKDGAKALKSIIDLLK